MRNLIVGICVAFAAATGAAERGIITGTISDKAGNPLVGANVVVSDSNQNKVTGTITDGSGNYRVDVPAPGRYQVSASYVGYLEEKPVTIGLEAGAELVVDVSLSSQMIFLEQSVVTASRRREKILDAPAS